VNQPLHRELPHGNGGTRYTECMRGMVRTRHGRSTAKNTQTFQRSIALPSSIVERETGLEPATICLEGRCSTKLSYSRRFSLIMDCSPTTEQTTYISKLQHFVKLFMHFFRFFTHLYELYRLYPPRWWLEIAR
jgi:hypothetical protein